MEREKARQFAAGMFARMEQDREKRLAEAVEQARQGAEAAAATLAAMDPKELAGLVARAEQQANRIEARRRELQPKENRNHWFYATVIDEYDGEDWASGGQASTEHLAHLRAEQKPELALRSCWLCNGAHIHFLKQSEMFFCCNSCGRYFFRNTDITQYEG